MRACVYVCVAVRALCFSPCMCLCVSSDSSGLAWCLPYRECHSKWVERPLTLTLPAQSRTLLAAISRGRLPITRTLSRVAEIKARLSGSHLEQAPFNPNGIRVAHEATWSSNPLLTPNATNSAQTRQSAQAKAQLISCHRERAPFNPRSANSAQAKLQLTW